MGRSNSRQVRVKHGVGSTEVVHGGLCLTCVQDATCTFSRDPARPVHSCEEFTDGTPAEGAPAGGSGPRVVGPRTLVISGLNADWGICCTCESAATCTFSHARDHVQFCEEFR